MIKGQTCSTCAAYSALTTECRVNPPTPVLIQGPGGQPAALGIFPAARPDSWCYSWRKPLPIVES